MGWFGGFRQEGENTYYFGSRTAAVVDMRQVMVLASSAVIATGLLFVIVGSRGKERWSNLFRALFSLHVGTVILVVLLGCDWQVADIKTRYPYRVTSAQEIPTNIQVHVGLKNVNITLQPQHVGGEGIFYNEKFSFNGFHDMEESFRRGRRQGLPEAILYVAEYFTVDMGGLRWCRSLREAGHFVYILLWTAFSSWIASVVLTLFVIFHGAALMTFSGVLMTSSCVIYHFLQPAKPLMIPFQDGLMGMQYGWNFWITLVTGIITMLVGFILLTLYQYFPYHVSSFLLADANYMAEDTEVDISPNLPLDLDSPYTKKAMLGSWYNNHGYAHDGIVKPECDRQKSKQYDNGVYTVKAEVCHFGRSRADSSFSSSYSTGTFPAGYSFDSESASSDDGQAGPSVVIRADSDKIINQPKPHSDYITPCTSTNPRQHVMVSNGVGATRFNSPMEENIHDTTDFTIKGPEPASPSESTSCCGCDTNPLIEFNKACVNIEEQVISFDLDGTEGISYC